jgi:hypothetical protein
MDAQDETKEKLLAEEERVKQNENEGVRVPCDSGCANYVVSERDERVVGTGVYSSLSHHVPIA